MEKTDKNTFSKNLNGQNVTEGQTRLHWPNQTQHLLLQLQVPRLYVHLAGCRAVGRYSCPCLIRYTAQVSTVNLKWTGYHGSRHGPGEEKLDHTFWTIAADRWGLNWQNLVHEGSSVYDASPGYRGRWFREHAHISAMPFGKNLPPPCTLHSQGLETDWYSDWWRAGLQTTARPDFSCPGLVCNSSKAERKGGGRQGGAAAGLLTNIRQKVCQNAIFWGHVRSSKRFERRFCRNRYL
jgi:hypothetical protein